ncbi:MAG: M23 family metallopeptidase [Oscillospiraceae bacterium]
MKKIIYIIGVIVLGLFAGTAIFWFQMSKSVTPPEYEVFFDDTPLSESKAHWETEVLPPYLPQAITKLWKTKVDVAYDGGITKIEIGAGDHKIKSEHPYIATLKDSSGKTIYTGEDFAADAPLSQGGSYTLEVKVQLPKSEKYRGSGQLSYIGEIVFDPQVRVKYSNPTPVQGELVTVEIQNILQDCTVKVGSKTFMPSAVYYDIKNSKAIFYLPITYYQPAGDYPISVNVTNGGMNYESEITLSVQPYEFSTISFNVDEETSSSTVNSAAANKEYREKIHPLYHTKDENIYWHNKMIKPVAEKKVSSQFGQKRFINNSKTPQRHSGIDYAAPEGTPVYAAAQGKVEFAGLLALSGNTVVIEHGLGLKSYYFHMSKLTVATGDMVEQSQQIGAVGTTGYSTGPHLHFQVSIENQPVNPELLY